MATELWLPTRPFTLRDACNRMAVATGSYHNAVAATGANYNGHSIRVDFSRFRQWAATYTWAGLRWLASRTTFEKATQAALREHNRGALGSEVIVACETDEQIEVCKTLGMVPFSHQARAAHRAEFLGPLVVCVNEAVSTNTIDVLLASSTPEEYRERLAERRRR